MAETLPMPSPLAPLALPPLVETRLENGLTLVAAERARSPLASVCLAFKAGSGRDPKGKAGLADFVVELLRRGTQRHSPAALDEALELMGADLRLETSPDTTMVGATVPAEHLEPTLALLAELVRKPAFAAGEVLTAKKRTMAQIESALDDPPALAGEALCRAALKKHPYGHPVRGLKDDVTSFSRADCVAWHERWMRPSGSYLVVAGDMPGRQVIDLCGALFGSWTGPEHAERPLPPVKEVEGRPVLVVSKRESSQAQVRLACAGPSRLYPELIAARLSAQIFGGSFSSRLVDAVRVTRGLSYGVSSYFSETEAGGLFVVSSSTKTGSARELIEVVLEEARRFRDEGPTPEELSRAQRYTNGLFPLSLETVEQLARSLAELLRFGRSRDWIERYRDRILEVRAEDALTQARRFFLPGGFAVAMVGDGGALASQLEGYGRVQVVPAEKLA